MTQTQEFSGGEEEAMTTVAGPRVWNRRTETPPPDAVYVGRPSKWGNPYRIGEDGTREEIIEKFRKHLEAQIPYGLSFELEELRGKDLVCWCAPAPCLADVLLELANRARP